MFEHSKAVLFPNNGRKYLRMPRVALLVCASMTFLPLKTASPPTLPSDCSFASSLDQDCHNSLMLPHALFSTIFASHWGCRRLLGTCCSKHIMGDPHHHSQDCRLWVTAPPHASTERTLLVELRCHHKQSKLSISKIRKQCHLSTTLIRSHRGDRTPS